MGNAAAMPISAKECEKYGITIEDVHGYNKVVKETKKKKKGKKLDKMDIDKIHKYCMETGKKSGKKGKGLHKLLEKQLMDASQMDQSTTQASTTHHSSTHRSSTASYDLDEGSILEFVPSVIELKEGDEASVLAGAAGAEC